MIECSECNSPNPPAGCPVDEDDEEEPEPCNTGDGTIDNPSFQNLMQQAATDSGFDNENESEKLEGFWAVYEVNGSFTKELLPYSSRSSCHFNISGTTSELNEIFSNAVMLLHTHPYLPFESVNQQECFDYLTSMGIDISSGVRYILGPSTRDLSTMNFINSEFATDLPLVTIDPLFIYYDDPQNTNQGESDVFTNCN